MADLINIGFRVSGGDKAAEDVKKLTEETKKLGDENKKTETAVKSYTAQIKALRLQLISLGERTKENAEEYDNLSERIRGLSESQEDLVIGTKKLDESLSALPGPVGRIGSLFRGFEDSIKNVRSAKIALIKQFPILKNAIAATGIGALVIVFGLLVGAVVKAFNSFKPLQEAVGRLGVAFELVEKLVQPVIDLVGRGLTVAVDGAAKAIAFLTGSLDEYNKGVADAAATAKLKSNLEQQKALFELNKDAFTEFEREKKQAYQDNLERFREIDEAEGLSNEQRNERKRASNALYYRDLERAEKNEQERKEANFKKEQERQRVLKSLTQDQIKQLNNLTNITLGKLQSRFDILKARQIEALGNPENIDKIRAATDFWNKALEITNDDIVKLQKQLQFLGGKTPDIAFEPLMTTMDKLQGMIGKSADEIDGYFDVIYKDLESAFGDDFISAVRGPLRIVKEDFKNIGAILKEAGIEGKESIEPLINGIRKFEQISLRGTLQERQKANEDFKKQQDAFVEKFMATQRGLIEEQYKKTNKITGDFTKEQRKQFEDSTESIRNTAIAAFNDIQENLRVAEAFRKEAKDINDIINKQIVPSMLEAVEKGNFNKVVEQNIDLYSSLVENILKDTKKLEDRSPLGFISNIKAVQDAFTGLNENIKISGQTAALIIDNLYKKRSEVDVMLKNLDNEFFANNYQQKLKQLEDQEAIDRQTLNNKKATEEQLLELHKKYKKKKEELEAEYTLYTMDASAQIFGNLASLFGEHTVAFKGLKYFEAIITAISSSVKAYESALEYGGPAGPVIAPILAATTFAAQQRQAMKILQTPEPSQSSGGGGGGAGPSGGLFGRDGGLVYGRTHEQGGVPAELEGGEFIINRRSMMMPGVLEIARQLNEMTPNPSLTQQMPVKAYVISGEMTTAQRADKRIRDLSRL